MPQLAARTADTHLLTALIDPSTTRATTLDLGDSIELFLASISTDAR
ncbi:hypothetical protein HQQ80_01805 [Microbacteriaceae bacterium VKM Ac-2855]|nr:hypothetical protein [Microbacteriaceae bacterium VKM Ac-2855]